MKKLHRILFFLLVLFLPIQLGRHFWPDSALIFGIRVDYLSPTIYLTDLLVLGVLGSWGFEELKTQNSKLKAPTKNFKNFFFAFSILCFLLLNVLLAQNKGAALYQFLKIIEFSLLGLYVARNNYPPSAIGHPLSLAIIYSSSLALAQFLFQRSLGGPLWWLGERTFSALTPGIALATWNGQLLMRSYATFPHPNVLAGFTLISLVIVVGGGRQAIRRTIKWLLVGFGAVTIILSFSRSAWIVGVLTLFWLAFNYLRRKLKKKTFFFVLCFLLFTIITLLFLASGLSIDEAINRRIQLNQVAIEMIRENPLIGIGLNNFIPRLSDYWSTAEAVRLLQPVHNIFLLIAVETGLIGLLFFFWFLYLSFKRISELGPERLMLCISLTAILLLGFFDHYWLTLQQTQLLFALVLGLSWAKR